MGCCQSKEKLPEYGQGHPELYYKGVIALHEGRFTVSEIYFQQAIHGHPGHSWWKELLTSVTAKDSKEKDELAEALERTDEGDSTLDTSEELKRVQSKSICTLKKDEQKKMFFPLDRGLEDIINYVRLLSDISHEYLMTSAGGSKARYIAALYNGSICLHLQLFMHLFALMRAQQDIDIRLKTGDPSILSYKVYVWSNAYREVDDDAKKKKKDKDAKETAIALMLTLDLVETAMRYYWLSAIFNYCLLIFRMSQGLNKEKDGKKRAAIFVNIIDNSTAGEETVMALANEYHLHFLGQSAIMFITPSEDGGVPLTVDVAPSSHQHSSEGLKQSKTSRFYSSLLGNSASGERRSLVGLARDFNPAIRNTLALPNLVPVRFVLPEVVLRRNRARIPNAGQRHTFHYVNWALSLDYDFIPGNSQIYLDRSMDGRAQFTPDAIRDCTLPCDPVDPPSATPALALATGDRALEGGDKVKRVRASEAFPTYDYHPCINQNVDYKNMHAVNVMGYEELSFLAKVVFSIKMRMSVLTGGSVSESARREKRFGFFMASMYGRNTFETAITQQLSRDMEAIYTNGAHEY